MPKRKSTTNEVVNERILKPISNHDLTRFEVVPIAMGNLVGRGGAADYDNENDKKWRGERDSNPRVLSDMGLAIPNLQIMMPSPQEHVGLKHRHCIICDLSKNI